MANITTDRNLKAIGPGIDESGIAESDMEAGDVVYDTGDGEYDLTSEDFEGTAGVVLNQYPPEDDDVDKDSSVKVRVTGVAIVETATGETVDAGDLVACAGDGKVKAIDEEDVTSAGTEDEDGSLLTQALSTAIGKAKTGAGAEEELVIKLM